MVFPCGILKFTNTKTALANLNRAQAIARGFFIVDLMEVFLLSHKRLAAAHQELADAHKEMTKQLASIAIELRHQNSK